MSDFEREDMELDEMFHGEEKPLHPNTVYTVYGKPTANQNATNDSNPGKNTAEKEKPVQEQWMPEKPAPNYMDKLRTSAKDMTLYGVLSVILFWWQQTGRLEETTAWYALLFCVGMVFFSVGRAWSGAVKE
jgi:hypothetical protein